MKESPIPSLRDIRGATGIPVFEVAGALEWMTGPVQVEDNDLASLLEFAGVVGARAVLVQYDYPMFDDYYVDPGEFPLEEIFDEEREDEIADLIDERNDELDEFLDRDYDGEPFAASVFVMHEGQAFGMYVEDDALIEAFGETAEEFIVRLLMEEE